MRSYNKIVALYWLQLLLVLALAGSAIFNGQWSIQSNLLSLLPQENSKKELKAAEKALFSQTEKQVVILVSGDDALAAYHALQNKIFTLAGISLIDNKMHSLADVSQFYLPYRHNLLSASYQDNLINKEAVTQMINAQLVQLSNPFVSETLAFDPRLNLADYLNKSFII